MLQFSIRQFKTPSFKYVHTLYILNLHNFICQFYLNKTEKRNLCFSLHFLLVLTLKIIQSWELRCFLGLLWARAQPSCSWVLPSRFLSHSTFFFPKPFGLFTDCPSHYTLPLVFVAQAIEMFLTNAPCITASILDFPDGTSDKEPAWRCRKHKKCEFNPWVGKSPWKRAWQPTPVFLPGESHEQRSLTNYSP